MPDAATLATLRAAGFEIISSKFITRLQEQVAELQQRNADLQLENANLTTSLNEELEHQLVYPPVRCLCCFSEAGCHRSSPQPL